MRCHLYKVQKQTRQTHAREKSGECLHGSGAVEGVQEMFLGGGTFCFLISVLVPPVCSVVASHQGAPLQFVHLSEWMFCGGGKKGERERQEKEDQLFFFHPKYSWGFPGGPVAETLCCQCRGSGFNPWSGN